MAKHTQTIRRLLPTNCLSVFDHFVELVLKWLNENLGSQLYQKLKAVTKSYNENSCSATINKNFHKNTLIRFL